MKSLIESNKTKKVVINLKSRPEKLSYIKNHLKSYGVQHDVFLAEKHTDPKRGCLESHITVIKSALKNKEKYKYIMILEDDCKFIDKIPNINKVPIDWHMISLGGTVHRVIERNRHKGFARVQCWTTHAYIINLEDPKFIDDLLKVDDYNEEIDRFYLEKIHPNYNCYMCDPMIALQKEGFSDIENKEVNYDFMQQTLNGLMSPEFEVDGDGNYVLKLGDVQDNDLPYISIITPTYKRRQLFSMALRNFNNFNYPKEKMEWVIVDDSPDIYESVKDMLPRGDKRIKFVHIPTEDGEPMTVAMKRNIAVSNSSNPYIVHMDDDDYYPPESVYARVKILLKYQESDDIQCVGSTLIGTYNLLKNISSMSSDGPISLSEASMAYTKKFWEVRPFDEMCKRGEHKYFTEQRLNKIMDIPYSFIIIAINHRNNLTNELRANDNAVLKFSAQTDKEGQYANFFDTWDLETQMFIIELRDYLLKF